jgi:hypothetical protein
VNNLHRCDPHEVVPDALRDALRWNARHDREAKRVMAEYKLKLPEDRETIRALAFVRVAQGRPAHPPASAKPRIPSSNISPKHNGRYVP